MCEGTSLATLNKMYLSFISTRCARCHGEFKWVLRFCNHFFKTTLVALTTKWDYVCVPLPHEAKHLTKDLLWDWIFFYLHVHFLVLQPQYVGLSHSLCTHGMVDMLKLFVTICKLKMWKKRCQPNTISFTSYVVFASHFSMASTLHHLVMLFYPNFLSKKEIMDFATTKIH